MRETYLCTVPDCDKVFTKAYELKKHKATHDDPNSVFHCPRCDFITLQKKNLGIHFAIHTGEKNLICPDMITVGNHEQQCDYRTSDPAALSKHRKKLHGYIPPPNRRRARVTPTSPRKTIEKKDKKVTRRRKPSQPVTPSPRRKLSRSPRKTKNSNGRLGNATTSANHTPFLSLENVGRDTNIDFYEDVGYDTGDANLVGTDNEIGLDTLFDPSLRSQWMAQYEMSYSVFDMTGMKHQLEVLSDDSAFDTSLDVQTGRKGCLCPEWMVEVGIESWDQSVLETDEYYMIDA